jgi:hypothetical protein
MILKHEALRNLKQMRNLSMNVSPLFSGSKWPT